MLFSANAWTILLNCTTRQYNRYMMLNSAARSHLQLMAACRQYSLKLFRILATIDWVHMDNKINVLIDWFTLFIPSLSIKLGERLIEFVCIIVLCLMFELCTVFNSYTSVVKILLSIICRYPIFYMKYSYIWTEINFHYEMSTW